MLPDGVCSASPAAVRVLLQVPYLGQHYYFLEDKIAMLVLHRIVRLQLPVLGIHRRGRKTFQHL